MFKACFSKSMVSKSSSQESKGVSLVITFHPNFLNRQLLNKHLPIFCRDQETKNVFTPEPMAIFRSACKLSSYLVRELWHHAIFSGMLYFLRTVDSDHKVKIFTYIIVLTIIDQESTKCLPTLTTHTI